ncbi:oxysterol-binding protein-related protein 1B-like [Silene latifolia]|uniref:oxysterol-binding protein-related protein 1B-like n=1 Tax=Silene latifolia TaxID=37657 RepID=UPI003D76DF92
MRIVNVAAFAVSGYALTEGRLCKPFNPLLGETYEADYPEKGFRFFSEKVSHHPTLVACHCEGRGWNFWADSNIKSRFWGQSIQLDPVGLLTLQFDDGEIFQWSKVTTSIHNLIIGKLYCDHHGTMSIRGNRQYSCTLKFKGPSFLDRNPNQFSSLIQLSFTGTFLLFSGSDDGHIHMYDAEGKSLIGSLSGHSSWVLSVDASPDGAAIASGSSDKSVKLWDLGMRAAVQSMTNHTDMVWRVAFRSLGGTGLRAGRLASVADYKSISLYDYS